MIVQYWLASYHRAIDLSNGKSLFCQLTTVLPFGILIMVAGNFASQLIPSVPSTLS
jgi:hypothetical protein